MPDHLHILSEGTADDSDCKRFIKAFKQYSGYYYSQARGHMLWQRYGFEHVVRDDEVTIAVAKYISRIRFVKVLRMRFRITRMWGRWFTR